MAIHPRKVVLAQLPIPPPGPVAVRGNVPLAAGYLKLLARNRGLESRYDLEIFSPRQANYLSDQGLVEAILDHRPWMVGFTCYLWNIERTLWVAEELKRRDPALRIMLGGPEITADNAWVLEHSAVDYAAIGEGEQTFCELLHELASHPVQTCGINGLYARSATGDRQSTIPFRQPLPNLNEISSPYLSGILDAADEQMMLLETIRGCIFKCKFCYYPKSYDALYFLSQDKLIANLRHARERGAREVVLLDPTLNQRKDFAGFVRLLADHNPDGQFTYFGELRAEGINAEIAGLLRAANFTEVEIGLQSIDPAAQELMDRKNNLRAFERGVRSMLDAGIDVKIDLIIGLPGDTVDSVRRGLHYLRDSGLYTSMQVFNLAILPGTAFRQEATQLGLAHQPRPPYYVTETPTLDLAYMHGLMEEAQELFGIEFDPLPPPLADERASMLSGMQLVSLVRIDLDKLALGNQALAEVLPDARRIAQSMQLWLTSTDFHAARDLAAEVTSCLLRTNPFATLEVVLEPSGDPRSITPLVLERIARACYARPTYLDKFYAVLPGRAKGAKRLVVVLPLGQRPTVGAEWIDAVGEFASIVWRGDEAAEDELEAHEYLTAT
jgi:radical SAM superfamily enzyme YgiQ (UPF0313 family)